VKLHEIVRLLFALIFLLGALANTYMGLFSPSVYETFADASILSLYQDLWNSLVYPSIRLFLIPVVLVELSVAWLLLKSGTYVKVGLGLALAFTLFLVPFWWQGGALANVFLALVLLWLLRYDYPRSIFDLFKGKLSSQATEKPSNI
jgi:cytochrome c biogenesis factor